MPELVSATSMDAWKDGISLVMGRGTDFSDELARRFRQVQNVSHEIVRAHDDITEPIKVLSRSEKWLYPSLEEIKSVFLQKKQPHSYKYTYGQRIFNYSEQLNQVDDFVIPLLKDRQHKMTRRLYINLWNPLKDSHSDISTEMPGLTGIWVKLYEKKLNVTGIIRNNNCFIGFPATLYQLSILQKYICKKAGLVPGKIMFYSLTMHIYLDHVPDIKQLLGPV